MKRTLIVLFLLVSVFCAPAEAQPCPDTLCPDGITKIADCPDEGCMRGAPDPNHPLDPELNKRKNIRSDETYEQKGEFKKS